MLAACQEHSKYFSDFDFQQLIDLARELTILYFNEGETVLCQGEPATFFGVVLKGAVIPVVGDQRIGNPRGTGEVIGETSLFTGGTRNASIVATQDGYLAVFGFAQLDGLFSTNASLASKLSRQLALATIDKQAEMARKRPTRDELERSIDELLGRQAQQHWSAHASADSGARKHETLLKRSATGAVGRRSSASGTAASAATATHGGGSRGRMSVHEHGAC